MSPVDPREARTPAWWKSLWTSLVRRDAAASRSVDERASAPVAHKYAALSTYLDKRYASVVVLTFGEIEDLLGFTLPDQARSDSQWWTGPGTTGSEGQARAWIAAHRTAVPNLGGRTVAFERDSAR